MRRCRPHDPAGRFQPGQRVRVRRFAWGEVHASSADAVRIAFPRHGVREIHPDFVLTLKAPRSVLPAESGQA